MNDKKPVTIDVKTLCTELKIDPREGRLRLRHAIKDTKTYPQLAATHAPGATWEWLSPSPQLVEARKALAISLPEKKPVEGVKK